MTMLQRAQEIDPMVMAILFTAKEKSLDRYAALEHGAFDVVEKNIRGTTAVREIDIKARAALRYREWSTRIGFLRRYFDPRVFAAIEEEPTLLEPSQRTVTICFWDIRGFSQLCEILKAHPPLISGFLREYCDLASRTVFEHGGVLDKFIGDGVMALFGVLDRQEGGHDVADAIRAVRAGFDLRERFDTLVSAWSKQWTLHTPQSITVGLGCGIHTGDALVGNVGTDFRDQFTALGPHVNFAARVEARASRGQILLSQSTKSRVESRFRLVQSGKVSDIKNIPGDFELFEALGKLQKPIEDSASDGF